MRESSIFDQYAPTDLYEQYGLSDDIFGFLPNPMDWIKKDEVPTEEEVEEVQKTVEETISKEEEAPAKEQSLTSKAKQFYNNTSPAALGIGVGVGSHLVFKTGLITSSIIGAVAYGAKRYHDKQGGLSDAIMTYNLIPAGEKDNKQLFLNKDDMKAYSPVGYDENGNMRYKRVN